MYDTPYARFTQGRWPRHPPADAWGRSKRIVGVEEQIASFAEWLAGQMRARRLSQEALAQRSGLHRSTISRIASGQRRPTLDTARRLAEALDAGAPFNTHFAHDPVVMVERALAGDGRLSSTARQVVMRTYLRLRED